MKTEHIEFDSYDSHDLNPLTRQGAQKNLNESLKRFRKENDEHPRSHS